MVRSAVGVAGTTIIGTTDSLDGTDVWTGFCAGLFALVIWSIRETGCLAFVNGTAAASVRLFCISMAISRTLLKSLWVESRPLSLAFAGLLFTLLVETV
jgi:hypothetical protein